MIRRYLRCFKNLYVNIIKTHNYPHNRSSDFIHFVILWTAIIKIYPLVMHRNRFEKNLYYISRENCQTFDDERTLRCLNSKRTFYCFSRSSRQNAIAKIPVAYARTNRTHFKKNLNFLLEHDATDRQGHTKIHVAKNII